MSLCAMFLRSYLIAMFVIGATVATTHAQATEQIEIEGFVSQYCLDCHNSVDQVGELSLEEIGSQDVSLHPESWEKVVRKLRARQMPPVSMSRPDEQAYRDVVALLESTLDSLASVQPNPGRTDSIRRLTRTEYRNAIRDLLTLDVDVDSLLPADAASHGFDNVTVGDLSPTRLNRYVSAAQKISRLAIGNAGRVPGGDTIRLPADFTQEEHVDGLPIGTRGGSLIRYTFPQDGEYDVQIRLARDRNEEIEGLKGTHELELLLDRRRIQQFTIKPPPDKNYSLVDARLKARFPVSAGPHELGVTFVKQPSSLLETMRQPYHAHFNMHRHPRITPAIYQISITGPFSASGRPDTPSRGRVFVCRPMKPDEEEDCAQRILATIMRRAYRRPVDDDDLRRPMNFFRAGRATGDFDAGIESALNSILVSPNFLFRVERDPAGVAPNTAYRISDLELASRLSFFLWSSIPDDELLDVAASGELSQPEMLRQQVRRMLADPRSRSLVTNFAGQWLYLRNLDSTSPNLRLFPDFDDNLRQAFRQETELLFEHVMRKNLSVLALLRADYTYVNERLAKHYGIPHVYGSRFRRVSLDKNSRRGGLLRHGSILTVTSYATRTSPVIRGHWILKNLLGAEPPPPPPNVPALKDNTVSASLSVRNRLAEHRANPACASCHDLMDPVGFALENFDAVGRWRDVEGGEPIDASGGLPDGSEFSSVEGLEQALLRRPEMFVATLTDRLLTYAVGRGVEHYDAPAIRQIVRQAKAEDFRFSSLIMGITSSAPFQMRRSE